MQAIVCQQGKQACYCRSLLCLSDQMALLNIFWEGGGVFFFFGTVLKAKGLPMYHVFGNILERLR